MHNNKNYLFSKRSCPFNRYLILTGLCLFELYSCKTTKQINYQTEKPGTSALVFLKDIVSTDSFEYNSCFSKDEKLFLFTRNSHGQSDVFFTTFDNGSWQTPAKAAFSTEKFDEYDPMFHPNGDLYFLSNRPVNKGDTSGNDDIWRVKRIGFNKWSEPENVKEVNSSFTEYYVSFAANGNMYFTSNRPRGFGGLDIYRSEFQNGKYQTPKNLGKAINSDSTEHDPFISPDEKFLFFTAVNRKDGFGEGDIYYAVKDISCNWLPAKNLGNKVNTEAYEFCSYISPDKKYFFFCRKRDVYWIEYKPPHLSTVSH